MDNIQQISDAVQKGLWLIVRASYEVIRFKLELRAAQISMLYSNGVGCCLFHLNDWFNASLDVFDSLSLFRPDIFLLMAICRFSNILQRLNVLQIIDQFRRKVHQTKRKM